MFSESDMSDVYGDWIDEETQTVVKVRTAVAWRHPSWHRAASQFCTWCACSLQLLLACLQASTPLLHIQGTAAGSL